MSHKNNSARSKTTKVTFEGLNFTLNGNEIFPNHKVSGVHGSISGTIIIEETWNRPASNRQQKPLSLPDSKAIACICEKPVKEKQNTVPPIIKAMDFQDRADRICKKFAKCFGHDGHNIEAWFDHSDLFIDVRRIHDAIFEPLANGMKFPPVVVCGKLVKDAYGKDTDTIMVFVEKANVSRFEELLDQYLKMMEK